MHVICILSLRNSSYFYLFNCTIEVDVRNFRCRCANCQRLNRVLECVCCRDNNEAIEVEGLAEPQVCIIQHHGFQAVCLNRWVLQTAWYQYRQQYKDPYEGREHIKNRHIDYRQLARGF